VNLAKASQPLQISERTADSYLRLLESVFLLHRLPAWGTTLTSRSASRPKVHVLDSGVAAWLLRLTVDKLARRDPASLTEFGHWRTRDGDEVDLVVEQDDGRVVAFEVKASQRVDNKELSGLRKLRGAVGDAFTAGLVLYLGERAYTAEDRLLVVPVDQLWT